MGAQDVQVADVLLGPNKSQTRKLNHRLECYKYINSHLIQTKKFEKLPQDIRITYGYLNKKIKKFLNKKLFIPWMCLSKLECWVLSILISDVLSPALLTLLRSTKPILQKLRKIYKIKIVMEDFLYCFKIWFP